MKRVAGLLDPLRTPLFRQASVYTVSNLLSRVAPFLLLPVLTRYLSPADYGLVAMFLLVVVVTEPFVSLGLPGAVGVRFYEKGVDMPGLVGTGLSLSLAAAAIVAIVLLVGGGLLETVTQVPWPWLLLAIPVVLGRTAFGTLMSLLRVREQARVFAGFQTGQTLITVALAVALVAVLQAGWPGRVWAEVLAVGASALAALLWLRRNQLVRRTLNRVEARSLLRFGVPLIPHILGGALLVQTDRLLLTNMVGLEQTGLYTVGYQLTFVIEIAAISFNNAYAPWLFKKLANPEPPTHRELVRLTYMQFATMAVLAVVVAVGMPILAGAILDPRYGQAAGFVGWLSLGFLFSAMYYMVTNYIFFARKTEYLAVVTLGTALVNIPLTYLLIQANGAIGAAQATAAALGLSFVLTWWASNRAYPMPWLGGLGVGRTDRRS